MSIIMLIGWPYYFVYPRVVMLHALSKGLKAMAEVNRDEQD